MTKKTTAFIILVLLIVAALFFISNHKAKGDSFDEGTAPKVTQSEKDPTPPNPKRPSFDQWGNEFDYRGKLIKVAKICIKGNPYCNKPAPTKLDSSFRGK